MKISSRRRSSPGPTFPATLTVLVCLFAATVLANAQESLPDAPSAALREGPQASQPGSGSQICCSRNSRRSGATESSAVGLVKRGVQDQIGIYLAPFRKSALKWDIGLTAVTGGLMVVDPNASRQFSGTSSTPSLQASDVGLYGTMGTVGIFYLSGAMTDNPHAKETGFLGAEALANTAITYTLLKTATGRERPQVGDGNGRFWHYNRLGSSFPSGHAALTWAGASVIAHEYPKRWVQVLSYGTATAVAFTRYSGRAHFPSDVVVGSAFGYLIGRHIFNSHCRKGISESCKAKAEDMGETGTNSWIRETSSAMAIFR